MLPFTCTLSIFNMERFNFISHAIIGLSHGSQQCDVFDVLTNNGRAGNKFVTPC